MELSRKKVPDVKAESKKGIGKFAVVLTILIVLVGVLNIPCFIEQYEKNHEAKTLQAELAVEKNKGERLKI